MIFERMAKELKEIKAKNVSLFEDTHIRLKGMLKADKEFCVRVSEAYGKMIAQVQQIQQILKDYLDTPVLGCIFGRNFDSAILNTVLNNYEFVAFLVNVHLINRALNLREDSPGQVKLRIYSAAMDFAEYKKMLS